MGDSMKNLKKITALLALSLTGLFSLAAQEITKFAVVDTGRVYQSYFRDSAPVRNYENKKAEFQVEINKRTDELQTLHNKKIEYKRSGDKTNELKVDAEIQQKTQFLTEYTNTKNIELENLKNTLQKNDSFYKKLYNILGRVAESGGYSVLMSLQQANGILWYSPSVDITDQVISELGLGL